MQRTSLTIGEAVESKAVALPFFTVAAAGPLFFLKKQLALFARTKCKKREFLCVAAGHHEIDIKMSVSSRTRRTAAHP